MNDPIPFELPSLSVAEFLRTFWSVQFKYDSVWITEKSWIDTEAEAMEFARNLADTLVGEFRVRICKNEIYSWDVTDDLL